MSPLTPLIVVPLRIPCITPFREFRLELIWAGRFGNVLGLQVGVSKMQGSGPCPVVNGEPHHRTPHCHPFQRTVVYVGPLIGLYRGYIGRMEKKMETTMVCRFHVDLREGNSALKADFPESIDICGYSATL